MSYFSKNWKIGSIFFLRKCTPFKFDESPVLKKAIKKGKKKEKKRTKKESAFKPQVN